MTIEKSVKSKFYEFLTNQKKLKPRSAHAYIVEINRLEGFGSKSMLDYRKYDEAAELLISLKKEKGLSDRTIFKAASMLKVYWDFCALYELIDFKHPFYLGHGFKKGGYNEPDFFDRYSEEDTLKEILWHWDVPMRTRIILWIFYSTGIRRGELASLTLGQVDMESRFLHIRAEDAKTGKYRDVPFDGNCQMWLEIWIRTLREYFGEKAFSPEFPLIPTDEGKHINPNSIWKLLDKLAPIFNIKINPHKWRHSLASFLVKHMDITQVAKIMGHANIQTTYQYTHSKNRTLRDFYDNAVENPA